jgi:ribosomal protein S18 acetylase RimI-like enzyme
VKPLTPVTTRLFEAPDLRALYAIEEACFEPAVRFSRALMRSLANDQNCRTWLGIVDNIRAGFAIVGLSGEDDPSAAYIWTIEVLPAFRRMGIARQLLMRVEESAREAGCAAIELHVSERNLDAVALYEGSRFARFGVDAEFYGRGEDAFRYRKELQKSSDLQL